MRRRTRFQIIIEKNLDKL